MADAADRNEGAKVLQIARRDDGEGDSCCLCGFLEGLQSVDDEAGRRRTHDLVEDAKVDRRNVLAFDRVALQDLPERVLHDLVEVGLVESLGQRLVPLLHFQCQIGQLR